MARLGFHKGGPNFLIFSGHYSAYTKGGQNRASLFLPMTETARGGHGPLNPPEYDTGFDHKQKLTKYYCF